MSEKLNILINWVKNISKQAHINSEREHTRLINAISIIDESVPLRKYKIDAHNKPVLAGALLSVSDCVDPYGNNPANICAERQTKFYKADFFTNTLDMTP